MNRQFFAVLSLVACMTLFGCDRATQGGGAPEQETQGSTEAGDNGLVASPKNMLEIGAGVELPTAFTFRSKSSKDDGAQVARFEFRGEGASAANALRKTLLEQGFTQASATGDQGGTLTRIYRDKNGLRLRVVLVPKGQDLKVEIAPDAAGLATFYWQGA